MPNFNAARLSSRFPTIQEIKMAMELAGSTIDGAEYLNTRIKSYAEKLPLEVKREVTSALDSFVESVKFKLTAHGQPWSGQQIEVSDFKNMQKNIADSAAKELHGKLTDIRLDYAVNEKGHYIRGYTADSGAMDSESVNALDNLFNAWLATKDYLVKDGYLYNANDLTQDEQNRINPDEIKELMAEGGLQEFMASKGINAVTYLQDYPGKQEEKQAKESLESALEKVSPKPQRAEARIESEEPPEPSSEGFSQ